MGKIITGQDLKAGDTVAVIQDVKGKKQPGEYRYIILDVDKNGYGCRIQSNEPVPEGYSQNAVQNFDTSLLMKA